GARAQARSARATGRRRRSSPRRDGEARLAFGRALRRADDPFEGPPLRPAQARAAAAGEGRGRGDHRAWLPCRGRRWHLEPGVRVEKPLRSSSTRPAGTCTPGALPPGPRLPARRRDAIPEIRGEILMSYRMQNTIALLMIAAVILLNAAL